MDTVSFACENYLAFLLLGGLLIIMYAYRDVRLPATRTFVLITIVLFIMCLSMCLERWATASAEMHTIRMAASVIHYILQPLVIYLEVIVLLPDQTGRWHRVLITLPLLINAAIYLIAPFAGELVFWYDEDYCFNRGPLGASIYFVSFLYLALLVYRTAASFHENDKRKSIIIFFVAGIGILTGFMEGFNIAPGFTDEAFVLGAFMFYIYLVTVHEHDVEESLIRKELELSKSELALLRQQIRPHFVFNALSIIKSLIRTDPAKAVQSLENFSDYLRANLDIIRNEGLVSFEEELDNIEAYVSLALADESKGINVVYDIQEHFFRLPPLSVEPLVENAIIHGITGGGTITLSTTSDEDSYIVKVSDDGCGFNEGSTDQEKKRTGIGIQNVRTRLEKQCNGTLEIKSGGSGTEITIRIPKTQGETF